MMNLNCCLKKKVLFHQHNRLETNDVLGNYSFCRIGITIILIYINYYVFPLNVLRRLIDNPFGTDSNNE